MTDSIYLWKTILSCGKLLIFDIFWILGSVRYTDKPQRRVKIQQHRKKTKKLTKPKIMCTTVQMMRAVHIRCMWLCIYDDWELV
jgi:hypothetical protein